MKACKTCKVPFPTGVDLNLLLRIFAIADIFRLLICTAPLFMVIIACVHIHPIHPKMFSNAREDPTSYILYKSNRTKLAEMETEILSRVEKSCGKDYKRYLPEIWDYTSPTLLKSLYLIGISFFFPSITSVSYLVFHKKERIAFIIGFVHVFFVMVAIVLGLYGTWFALDNRLCLLNIIMESYSVPWFYFSGVVLYGLLAKAVSLMIIYNFIKNDFKVPNPTYQPPSPAEELAVYLKEMKRHGVTPKVQFDLPNMKKLTWEEVEQVIKKILVDIRIQVAEIHKDDPIINDLLQSGKLQGTRKRRKSSNAFTESGGGTGPNILKIAKMMVSESSEYRLLKQSRQSHSETDQSRDDVEIILPEPEMRDDDGVL